MRYSEATLSYLYDKTAGRCHICRKPLSFREYGRVKASRGWEVDHSRPRARGGSDYRRNLLPACVRCNRSKGDRGTRAARRAFGHTRAPISRQEIARRRVRNVLGLGVLGVSFGSLVTADVPLTGALLGGLLGVLIGAMLDVE